MTHTIFQVIKNNVFAIMLSIIEGILSLYILNYCIITLLWMIVKSQILIRVKQRKSGTRFNTSTAVVLHKKFTTIFKKVLQSLMIYRDYVPEVVSYVVKMNSGEIYKNQKLSCKIKTDGKIENYYPNIKTMLKF